MKKFGSILALLLLLSPINAKQPGNYEIVRLEQFFNNDGIASDANRLDGNFDGIGPAAPGSFNYAAEQLPGANSIITVLGIPFYFPDKSDGKNNNVICAGQQIAVPAGHYVAAYFLGASTNGDFKATLTVCYEDMCQPKKLGLSDWCRPPKFGEYPAISGEFRQFKDGNTRIPEGNHIWLQAITLDTSRKLTTIHLPDMQSMHIFALTVGRGQLVSWGSLAPEVKQVEQPTSPVLNLRLSYRPHVYEPNELIHITAWLRNYSGQWPIELQATVADNITTPLIFRKIISKGDKPELYTSFKIERCGVYQVVARAIKDGQIMATANTSFAIIRKVEYIRQQQAAILSDKEHTQFKPIRPDDLVGINYSFAKGDPSMHESAAMLLKMAGISWIREEFSWSQIEPNRGEWNWRDYDRGVETAQQFGLKTYGLIDYWTGWTKPYTEQGFNDYANYVYQLVSHYKDKIKYWEIWNEPNVWYWKGTAKQYAELLKKAYEAAKKADPNCLIAGCVTAGTDLEFIEKVFKAGGFNYLDIVSIHPYRGDYPAKTNFEQEMQNAFSLIKKYGGGKELWITETGWWTGPRGFSPEKQANYLVRTYLLARALGIKTMFWFCFLDPPAAVYDIRNFGIVTHRYEPKPAYAALAQLTRMTAGAKVKAIHRQQNLYALQMKDYKAEALTVLWAIEGEKKIKITAKGQLKIFDIYGNQIDPETKENSFILNVTESPVYLRGECNMSGE